MGALFSGMGQWFLCGMDLWCACWFWIPVVAHLPGLLCLFCSQLSNLVCILPFVRLLNSHRIRRAWISGVSSTPKLHVVSNLTPCRVTLPLHGTYTYWRGSFPRACRTPVRIPHVSCKSCVLVNFARHFDRPLPHPPWPHLAHGSVAWTLCSLLNRFEKCSVL